jgi:hypothetical protein
MTNCPTTIPSRKKRKPTARRKRRKRRLIRPIPRLTTNRHGHDPGGVTAATAQATGRVTEVAATVVAMAAGDSEADSAGVAFQGAGEAALEAEVAVSRARVV